MSVQIDQIFSAKAENIQQFLSTAGQGCYIPAYQRPYAWDEDNVDRLIEDAANGLSHLLQKSDRISFLGTIIAIHDTKFVTVKPVFHSEVAQRVMTLIDGQQRVSTFVMMNIALHDAIRTHLKKLPNKADEHLDWAREQSERALAELLGTFALDQTTGTPNVYRFYPRVIRAFDDVWSKKASQAVYRSPIARLIWTYIQHAHQGQGAFKYQALDQNKKADPNHQPLIDVFRYIRNQLNRLVTGKVTEYDFPDVQEALQNVEFEKALWGFALPPAVRSYLSGNAGGAGYLDYCSLFRLLLFFKYFNTRMALTIVTTRSEDDAFDMFEALNTTGEPLTAFETFKPKVIEVEGLDAYQQSPSFANVARIEQYLAPFKKAEERQRATSEMLIPFALAETGEKLQKALSDQRRYLRDYFEKLSSLEDKRDCVNSLANLSTFLRTGWDAPSLPELEAMGPFDDETGFCFESLRVLKHTIAIGPMSRFYEAFLRSEEPERTQKKQELIEVIRAVTAFSMMWRAGYGATENIESVYRTVMREGAPELQIASLAKRPKYHAAGPLSCSSLKQALWSRLTKAFPDKDAWTKAASRIPIYKHSKDVARFIGACQQL